MGFLDNVKKALGFGSKAEPDSEPEPAPESPPERNPEPRPGPAAAAAPEPEVSAAPDPEPAAEDPGDQGDGGKTYTVQSGDTLWKIAEQHYGDGSKYTKIFEANRPMLEDPDKIYPGQELVIPKIDD